MPRYILLCPNCGNDVEFTVKTMDIDENDFDVADSFDIGDFTEDMFRIKCNNCGHEDSLGWFTDRIVND